MYGVRGVLMNRKWYFIWLANDLAPQPTDHGLYLVRSSMQTLSIMVSAVGYEPVWILLKRGLDQEMALEVCRRFVSIRIVVKQLVFIRTVIFSYRLP